MLFHSSWNCENSVITDDRKAAADHGTNLSCLFLESKVAGGDFNNRKNGLFVITCTFSPPHPCTFMQHTQTQPEMTYNLISRLLLEDSSLATSTGCVSLQFTLRPAGGALSFPMAPEQTFPESVCVTQEVALFVPTCQGLQETC